MYLIIRYLMPQNALGILIVIIHKHDALYRQ